MAWFAIPPDVVLLSLRVIFSAALGLSLSLGIILSYHWFRFSMNPVMPFVAVVAYGGVCAILLALMFSIMQTL
jgi:hypothetical protein